MSRKNVHKSLASIDIETTGLNPYKGAEIFSYCIGWDVDNGEDCRVEVFRLDKDETRNKQNWRILREFFADSSIVKIAHNYKFELGFLLQAGIDIPENTTWHDTMIMSQMLRNISVSHALSYLCWELGGYSREIDEKVKDSAKAVGGNYRLINEDLMTEYQIADGERPLLLYYTFFQRLTEDKKLYKCYLQEIELVKVTQRMESLGIMIDRQNINELQDWLENELDKVQRESFALLGEYVNLNSDDQVARILFRKYQFPMRKLTETGKESTDKDVLSEMRKEFNHPIFDLILRQRSYSGGLATLKSYLKFAGETETINPNINTNRARTGRQSSSVPNLQNVSKESALKNPYPVPLRKSFRARPKFVLLFVDQKGIEMRLIVDATREPELYDMIKKDPDADLHHPTVECFLGSKEANRLLNEDKKQYTIFRYAYKNTGFCISYGGSIIKVALTLDKSVDEVRAGDTNYRARFQRINNFTPSIVEQVRDRGYIKTAFGRKLSIPFGKAYIGSNYLIQGTAAQILKIGQNRVDAFIRKELNDKMRMILCIHDELVFSFPRSLLKEKDWILPEISRIMINIPEIAVPLRVEWKMSTTDWNSAKEIDVEY